MEHHHATIFEAVADVIPEAPALAQGDRVVTWAQMDDRSARLAAALRAGQFVTTGSCTSNHTIKSEHQSN